MTSTTPAHPPENPAPDTVHVENGTVWLWDAHGRVWTRLNTLPPGTTSTVGTPGAVTVAGEILANVAAGVHQAGITRPGEAYRRGR